MKKQYSDYLLKRYQDNRVSGISNIKTNLDEDAYSPINFKSAASEVKLPQLPSFERETYHKLPIFKNN